MKLDEKGTSELEHLELAASKGDVATQALLDNIPECPEDIAYLVKWARELVGRSGASMAGPLPVSPTVIKDWVKLKGIRFLHPLEFEALLELDNAILNCDEEPNKENNSILQDRRKSHRPWPKAR